MKTPLNINGNDLATFLLTATELYIADLFTITLQDGTIIRYTTFDEIMLVPSPRYAAPSYGLVNIDPKLAAGTYSIVIAEYINEVLVGLTGMTTFTLASPRLVQLTFPNDDANLWRLFMTNDGGLTWYYEEVTGPVIGDYSVSAMPATLGILPTQIEYLPGPPLFERGQIEETVGTEVSAMDLMIYALPTDLLEGIPIIQSIQLGYWEKATVLVERMYLDSSLNQIGKITRFLGQVGELIKSGRTEAQFSVKSMMELLTTKMPKNVIQSTCIHTVYDEGCLANIAAHTETVNVQSGTNTIKLIVTGATKPTGEYDLGKALVLTGELAGKSYSIRSYTHGSPNSTVVLARTTPVTLAPGDLVDIIAGCDNLMSTCDNKFSNLAHFVGFPFTPVPEAAL